MSEPRFLHKAGDPPTRYHVWELELSKRPDMFPFVPEAAHEEQLKKEVVVEPKTLYWPRSVAWGEYDIFHGDNETVVEHIKGKAAAAARCAELNGGIEGLNVEAAIEEEIPES
jgi:hypothetical protein